LSYKNRWNKSGDSKLKILETKQLLARKKFDLVKDVKGQYRLCKCEYLSIIGKMP
jgi:hypothetical protein